MRKLIHIPIVHTTHDLGSFLEKVKEEYIAKFGLKQWNQHIRATEELWRKIKESVLTLPIDFTSLKVFQDGLPVCDREMEIVQKLAESGSLNHRLLIELIQKGAQVIGTEDLSLLLKERDRLLKSHEKAASPYDDLIAQRDMFIAQRISSILQEGQTGLLFMGALHKVEKYLPKNIDVRILESVEK